jgi:thiaminase
LNNPDSAIESFLKSVKISPSFKKKFFNKKEIGYSKYMYLGQLSEGKTALSYFQKGIAILLDMKTQKVSFLVSKLFQEWSTFYRRNSTSFN